MEHMLQLAGSGMEEGFPKDFLWGVSMSAKQAEGKEGRGLTVADIQNYNPQDTSKVKGDYSLAEIIDRVQHPEAYWFPKEVGIELVTRYREDIALLAGLGIRCLRFSMSWSRIFPQGDDAAPNEEGLAFYDAFLDELEKHDIEPIVTIYHDDMPIRLATEYNGLLSPHVQDSYLRYAKCLLDHYSDRVHYWIPFNQVNLTRVGLSALGIVRDQVEDLDAAKMQAVHNKLCLAASVARYGRQVDGRNRFGAMLADFLVNPRTCAPEDVLFATEKNQLTMYLYADVQLRGAYPGYALRYFKDRGIDIYATADELQLLQDNTMDFLAVSYYNSNVVSAKKNTLAIGDGEPNPYVEATPWGWTVNPTGLLDAFLKYWDRYQVPLMVAENGIGQVETPDADGVVHDEYRIAYMRDHLAALREAIRRGVDVFAYCSWSPIDMVSSGTSEMCKRYGLIYNDQDDFGRGTHKRTPKDSYWWYRDVIASNGATLS